MVSEQVEWKKRLVNVCATNFKFLLKFKLHTQATASMESAQPSTLNVRRFGATVAQLQTNNATNSLTRKVP